MTVARRFVVQVLGGDGASDLTDSQWAELCRTAENSSSDQLAVAQVVLKAYALRNVEKSFGARRGFSDGSASVVGRFAHRTEYPPTQRAVRRPAIKPVSVPSEFTDPNGSTFSGSDVHPPSKFDDVGEQGPHRSTLPIGRSLMVKIPTSCSHRLFPPPSNHARSDARRVSFIFASESTRSRGIDALDDRSRARWLTVASWVRNIGAIILLFVAWQLWGTAITEHHSQEALTSQFRDTGSSFGGEERIRTHSGDDPTYRPSGWIGNGPTSDSEDRSESDRGVRNRSK